MESSSGKIYRKALRAGLGKCTVGSLCICKADERHDFTELSVSDNVHVGVYTIYVCMYIHICICMNVYFIDAIFQQILMVLLQFAPGLT